MTSTTDTTGHPDVTEISDLTEGLLTASRSADLRRHLDGCALCADVHASLEEIRGLLGTVPGPPRMPDDVAQRIDAALAAEALLTATAPEPKTTPETPQTASAVTADAEAPHVSRETPAGDRPSGRARTASTGPGRKGGKDSTGPRRGVRRRGAVLGALLGVAALGLGGVLVSSLTGDEGSDVSSPGQSTAADTFAQGTLERKVANLLDTAQGSKDPDSLAVESAPSSPRPKILQQPTVPPCVQKGIGRSDAALATEEGRYRGTDALLVVLPDVSDSTKVDAYIVDRTCVTHPSSDPAKILLKNSYTRR